MNDRTQMHAPQRKCLTRAIRFTQDRSLQLSVNKITYLTLHFNYDYLTNLTKRTYYFYISTYINKLDKSSTMPPASLHEPAQ